MPIRDWQISTMNYIDSTVCRVEVSQHGYCLVSQMHVPRTLNIPHTAKQETGSGSMVGLVDVRHIY